jgi:hypothetical protein
LPALLDQRAQVLLTAVADQEGTPGVDPDIGKLMRRKTPRVNKPGHRRQGLVTLQI